jgi:hypothetical protein
MVFEDRAPSRYPQPRSPHAIESALGLIECSDIGIKDLLPSALSFVLSALLLEFGKFSIFAVALAFHSIIAAFWLAVATFIAPACGFVPRNHETVWRGVCRILISQQLDLWPIPSACPVNHPGQHHSPLISLGVNIGELMQPTTTYTFRRRSL